MDAEAWLASERKLIDQDLWTSPKTRAAQRKAEALTLNEYGDRWIEQRNVKPGTKIEYKRTWARLIAPTLGRLPLKTIGSDTVRAWFAALGVEHQCRNSRAYGLLHAVMS
ncbi:MAG TPA: integrase, partial [Mycobacterium sp.]|nr:integrase [Mycobacterium sp.]